MSSYYEHEIVIPDKKGKLTAELTIPAGARTIVIFSRAGGCSRRSRRSHVVAEHLHNDGFGTLLPDLLTADEIGEFGKGTDIGLLSERLILVTQFLQARDLLNHYSLGYYGTSTGAAVALNAAARLPGLVKAIVCRGGRPDLALKSLPEVEAPTLLIVGDQDSFVLPLNRDALEQFTCIRRLEVISGTAHSFDEPGKIEEVDRLAGGWFRQYLIAPTLVNQ
jgi:dienelactone hydrolase